MSFIYDRSFGSVLKIVLIHEKQRALQLVRAQIKKWNKSPVTHK